jgi:DNA-binding NtrC family response regulator
MLDGRGRRAALREPSASATILVVDDESLIRETLAEFLAPEGFQVRTCADGESALLAARAEPIDVALCDVHLPGIDGIELLTRLRQVNPETLVLLITAYATVENAVEAFQRGAHDYLMKPVLLDEVLMKIRRALAHRELHLENQRLRRELNRSEDVPAIVGDSAAMQRVMDLVRKVAPTPSTVLLLGESGTGKELIARALHNQGQHPEARFLPVNCAAIATELLENQLFGRRKGAFTGADRDQEGVFGHAGRGTVFLDEIGELSPAIQAKLLRAIEQKEVMPVGANEPTRVEARVIAATNKDLRAEVAAGRFREDLFYRLNVVSITLPPLRDRQDDIPSLVDFLLQKHARMLNKRIVGVSHETLRLLGACPWKGNVRELDNVLQRAVILADKPILEPSDLPPDLVPMLNQPSMVDDLSEAVRRFERIHIERILRQTADKREAARRLNVGLSSLYRRISELEIPTSTASERNES